MFLELLVLIYLVLFDNTICLGQDNPVTQLGEQVTTINLQSTSVVPADALQVHQGFIELNQNAQSVNCGNTQTAEEREAEKKKRKSIEIECLISWHNLTPITPGSSSPQLNNAFGVSFMEQNRDFIISPQNLSFRNMFYDYESFINSERAAGTITQAEANRILASLTEMKTKNLVEQRAFFNQQLIDSPGFIARFQNDESSALHLFQTNPDILMMGSAYTALLERGHTAEDRRNIYRDLQGISLENKLLFSNMLGNIFPYNNDMAGGGIPQINTNVDNVWNAMRANDPGQSGVCTHAALTQTEALTAMGINSDDVRIGAYSTQGGFHAAVIVKDRTTGKDYLLNYSTLQSSDGNSSLNPNYSYQGGLPADGIRMSFYDAAGGPLGHRNLPLGDFLSDVSGATGTLRVNPMHSLYSNNSHIELRNSYVTPGGFTGTTYDGTPVFGITAKNSARNFNTGIVLFQSNRNFMSMSGDPENYNQRGIYFNHAYLKEFRVPLSSTLTFGPSIGYRLEGMAATHPGKNPPTLDGGVDVRAGVNLRYLNPRRNSIGVNSMAIGGRTEISPIFNDIRDYSARALRPIVNTVQAYGQVRMLGNKLTFDTDYIIFPSMGDDILRARVSGEADLSPNIKVSGQMQTLHSFSQNTTFLSAGGGVTFSCRKKFLSEVELSYQGVIPVGSDNQAPGSHQVTVCVKVGNR